MESILYAFDQDVVERRKYDSLQFPEQYDGSSNWPLPVFSLLRFVSGSNATLAAGLSYCTVVVY